MLAEHEDDWFSTADLIDAPGGLLWATAARLRLPLMTKDRQIHDYARTDSSVEVLW